MRRDPGAAPRSGTLVDQRYLLREFRWQFIGRSLAAVVSLSFVLGALLLLTSAPDSWWFSAFAWLAPVGRFLRESKPWDLFVYLFLASAVVSYVLRFAEAWYERHNFLRLRDLSREQIAASDDTSAVKRSEKVLLGIRRLTLNALLREASALAQMAALATWMLIVGLPVSALLTAVIGFAAVLLQPWLTQRFAARRPRQDAVEQRPTEIPLTEIEDRVERRRVRAERIAARPDDDARLEAQYASMEERLGHVANRTLLRLTGGWPIVLGLVVGAALIAAETVIVMASGEGPGGRAVLLLTILALTGRCVLSLAHSVEEVAFYASGSTAIGTEPE